MRRSLTEVRRPADETSLACPPAVRSLLLAAAVALALTLAPAHPASGEGAGPGPPTTPTGLVDAFLAATQAGDWKTCAALMHPEALERMHGFLSTRAKELAGTTPAESFVALMSMAEESMGSEVLRSARGRALGSVEEGELVHVVYRLDMTIQGTSLSKVSLMSVKRHGGEWRGLLTAELEGMISG